jgi:hypothetical protein
MADRPVVKIMLAGGFSVIHDQVSLHDLIVGLAWDPQDPQRPYSVVVFCLVRNPPEDAVDVYVEISRVDHEGVETVAQGASPLFPAPFPGYSLALVGLQGFRLPAAGMYTVQVASGDQVIHQEPLPVFAVEDEE